MTQSDYQSFQGFCDGVLMSDDAKLYVAEAAAEGLTHASCTKSSQTLQ
jgi:hypothetical protein